MLKGKDIICISPIDWSFLRQRHQVFMEMLAKNKNRVIYIENLSPCSKVNLSFFLNIFGRVLRVLKPSKINKNSLGITVITPLVIPFKNKIAEFINTRILNNVLTLYLTKAIKIKKPVIWSYLSTASALRLINSLNPEFIIYDAVFDASLHPNSPSDIKLSEKKLTELADLIFTDNHYLFEKFKRINKYVYIIPPGVDFEHFSLSKLKPPENTSLLNGIKMPRICFFGGIDDIRMDLDLIEHIAKQRPDWNIILFGPVVKTDITKLKIKNIFFKGALSYQALPYYLREMSVLIIPYKTTEFCKSVFPAKTFECLATGKPVVSTPLDEFVFLNENAIKIAKTKEEFVLAIKNALCNDNEETKEKRLKIARENSWEKRFETIKLILEERLK